MANKKTGKTSKILKAKKAKAKRRDPEYGSVEYNQNAIAKKYGIRKMPRSKTGYPKKFRTNNLDEFQGIVSDLDQAKLKDLKESIRIRKKIFKIIPKFEAILKAGFGSQIRVGVHLSDLDEMYVKTYFRPRKNQHPFDADRLVDEAFRISGLHRYMEHSGQGKNAGVRDHDFFEIKYQPPESDEG